MPIVLVSSQMPTRLVSTMHSLPQTHVQLTPYMYTAGNAAPHGRPDPQAILGIPNGQYPIQGIGSKRGV